MYTHIICATSALHTGASFASRLAVLNAARWVVCPVIWTPVTLPVIACAAARGTKLVAYDRPLKAHARRVERNVAFVTQEHEALVVAPLAKKAVSCVGHVSVAVAKRVRGVCARKCDGQICARKSVSGTPRPKKQRDPRCPPSARAVMGFAKHCRGDKQPKALNSGETAAKHPN